MIKYAKPTADEQFDFLIRCYFGAGKDQLGLCISRAYRDLNRTLSGIASHRSADALRTKGHALVAELLGQLSTTSADQPSFDDWHKRACLKLRKAYLGGGYKTFTIGQAQKWLNMSLKYVFTMGATRLPGYEPFYDLAHIPVDNVIMEQLATVGIPRLEMAWSKLDQYDRYVAFQKSVREKFPGSAPLAVEFRLWIANAPD